MDAGASKKGGGEKSERKWNEGGERRKIPKQGGRERRGLSCLQVPAFAFFIKNRGLRSLILLWLWLLRFIVLLSPVVSLLRFSGSEAA